MAQFDCAAHSQQRTGSPPAAKAADTRERILQAAREVFSELGYDAATFQAIAIRSDLTRPAINHYFESKRVLYREVIEQTNAMVVGAGFERAKAQSTLLARLSAFFSAVMQTDTKDRSVAAFLVTSVLEAQRHPELAHETHDSLASSREFLSWAVREAMDSGGANHRHRRGDACRAPCRRDVGGWASTPGTSARMQIWNVLSRSSNCCWLTSSGRCRRNWRRR